ncbi:MAG: copper amine oxidase N-terminal domain-containing protein [Clostridia bacterium]|nr:copper amine oxidase N-terminal domain-containing protein [Clostridia bacterium]
MSKTFKLLFIILSLGVFLCLGSIIGYADDSAMGRTPDGVYPMNDADVSMESEDIIVKVQDHKVECNFTFKNSGKAKDVLMGFPKGFKSTSDTTTDEELEAVNFKAYINGKPIAVKEEKGAKSIVPDTDFYTSWYTFNVHFDEGQTIQIKNTYEINYSLNSMGYVFLGYVLTTGKGWKDPIGHAKVSFELGNIKPYQIKELTPYFFRFEGNKLVFEKSNFEPTYNLSFTYNSWTDDIPDFADYLKQSKKYFDNVEKSMKNADLNTLIGLYNKAVKDGEWIIALYIKSKIPVKDIPDVAPSITGFSIEPETSIIRGQINDPNGNVNELSWKVTHMEKGKEITDLETTLDEDSIYFNRYLSQSNVEFAFLPGKNYTITLKVKDSTGKQDTQTTVYPRQKGQNSIMLKINDPMMRINGYYQDIDFENSTPVIADSKTFLPIRSLIEALGGNVAWEGSQKKVTITLQSKTIELWIGKQSTKINGKSKPIEAPPRIINGRTMVPLRYVIENLGYKVEWNGSDKSISIQY